MGKKWTFLFWIVKCLIIQNFVDTSLLMNTKQIFKVRSQYKGENGFKQNSGIRLVGYWVIFTTPEVNRISWWRWQWFYFQHQVVQGVGEIPDWSTRSTYLLAHKRWMSVSSCRPKTNRLLNTFLSHFLTQGSVELSAGLLCSDLTNRLS